MSQICLLWSLVIESKSQYLWPNRSYRSEYDEEERGKNKVKKINLSKN